MTAGRAKSTGAMRVARGSPGGHTLELHRVGTRELCAAPTSCLFGSVALQFHGPANEAIELVRQSPACFARWVDHLPFRSVIFGTFADRLADLMALANEQGTMQEIVTRPLQRFERDGGDTPLPAA